MMDIHIWDVKVVYYYYYYFETKKNTNIITKRYGNNLWNYMVQSQIN